MTKSEDRKPYELRLDEISLREVQDNVVQQEESQVTFDEKAEMKKIAVLKQKIKEEKAKSVPDNISISRWQSEIVSIRQKIMYALYIPIKLKGRQ